MNQANFHSISQSNFHYRYMYHFIHCTCLDYCRWFCHHRKWCCLL